MEVSYDGIMNNKVTFIPLERCIKGIGIDNENEKNETSDMRQRVVRQTFL
jgi:hypothetical protein